MEEYLQKTINTYNKTAKEYVENVKGLVPMNELEKFIKYVSSGKILDIGCGSGVAAKNIQEKGHQVYGVDLSEELLKAAKKESPNSKFYMRDMRVLGFNDSEFDGIWHVASLLHLEKKDVPTALNEANRVLKSGGVMYLSIKGGEGEGIELDKRYDGLPKQYTYFETEEINKLLENANFEVLENYPIQYDDIYRIAHPWFNIFVRKNF